MQTELIAESIDSQYVQVSIGSTRLLVPRGDLHALCVLALEDPEWLKSMIRLTAGRNQDFDLTDTTLALPDGLQHIASQQKVRVKIQQPTARVILESLGEREILKQTFALNGGSKAGLTVGMVLEGEDHQRIKIVSVEQGRSTAEAVYLAKSGEAYYWIRSRQYVSTPKTARFLVFRKER